MIKINDKNSITVDLEYVIKKDDFVNAFVDDGNLCITTRNIYNEYELKISEDYYHTCMYYRGNAKRAKEEVKELDEWAKGE